ncbi:hypothetical protein GGF31_002308 [Allomyces arbusculus]|nr:hypothetical protein GGF31_002308 [Allomyces arbusculus]
MVIHVHVPEYWTLVAKTLAVTYQVATVVLFVGVFIHLHDGRLDPLVLVAATASLLAAAWVGFFVTSSSRGDSTFPADPTTLATNRAATPSPARPPRRPTSDGRPGSPMLSGRDSAGGIRSARDQTSTAKSVIILVAVVLALSPILKTLTMDTSSDSIWALATLFFICHLLMSDYRATRSAALTY